MIRRAADLWEWFWYRPGSALNLAMARIVVAATALWIVLSRPDVPGVLAFPQEFWASVPVSRRLRYLMVFDLDVERVLYAVLHVALLAALLGVLPRLACFASGLLLYHLGPFMTVMRTGNPYLLGFDLPSLALLILAFSRCGDRLAIRRGRDRASVEAGWEYRWPLVLMQILVCAMYFFAGYSKLLRSGAAWVDGDSIRRYLLVLNQLFTAAPSESPGYLVAGSAAACTFLAWAGVVFELVFPAVLFVSGASWIFVALAVLFHIGNSVLFRIFFPNVWLLALFVDWDGLRRGVVSRR